MQKTKCIGALRCDYHSSV